VLSNYILDPFFVKENWMGRVALFCFCISFKDRNNLVKLW